MTDLLIALLKSPLPLILIVIGLVVMLIAAEGYIPVIQSTDGDNPPIHGMYQIVLFIVGFLILPLGAYGCFLKVCNEPESNMKKKLKLQPPIECEGEVKDLYVGYPKKDDLKKIEPMGDDRRFWSYELSDIKLRTFQEMISLEFKADIVTRRKNIKEHYECYGEGPYIGGVGYLTYSFKKVGVKGTSWVGSMVLRVPRVGVMYGFWLTTNVYEDINFPIGTITLKRKV